MGFLGAFKSPGVRIANGFDPRIFDRGEIADNVRPPVTEADDCDVEHVLFLYSGRWSVVSGRPKISDHRPLITDHYKKILCYSTFSLKKAQGQIF